MDYVQEEGWEEAEIINVLKDRDAGYGKIAGFADSVVHLFISLSTIWI